MTRQKQKQAQLEQGSSSAEPRAKSHLSSTSILSVTLSSPERSATACPSAFILAANHVTVSRVRQKMIAWHEFELFQTRGSTWPMVMTP